MHRIWGAGRCDSSRVAPGNDATGRRLPFPHRHLCPLETRRTEASPTVRPTARTCRYDPATNARRCSEGKTSPRVSRRASESLGSVRPSSREKTELVRALIDRFVQEWKDRREPRIEDYLSRAGAHRAELFFDLLCEDMKFRMDQGKDHEVERYLERFPDLGDQEAAFLIAHDYELRLRRGTQVVKKQYLDRFPRLDSMLASRFASMESDEPDLDRPSTLNAAQFRAKFELIEKLGEGGMGQVWLVRHRDLDEVRVVKCIHSRYLHNRESRERLWREARAMSRVRHPHAAEVFDVGRGDDPYIEMEYIRGRPLSDLLKPNAPLPLKQTIQILQQLCDVLQTAHERGIIHRDLKPSNLMLVAGGDPGTVNLKVLDFGLAKFREGALGEGADELTADGQLLGTPLYMSPEQVSGTSPLDRWSDIYSVGMILYELLTGCRPFTSPRLVLFHDILHTPAPPSRRGTRTRTSRARDQGARPPLPREGPVPAPAVGPRAGGGVPSARRAGDRGRSRNDHRTTTSRPAMDPPDDRRVRALCRARRRRAVLEVRQPVEPRTRPRSFLDPSAQIDHPGRRIDPGLDHGLRRSPHCHDRGGGRIAAGDPREGPRDDQRPGAFIRR